MPERNATTESRPSQTLERLVNGTTYTCDYCTEARRGVQADRSTLVHCEVCGAWVPPRSGILSRDLDLPSLVLGGSSSR